MSRGRKGIEVTSLELETAIGILEASRQFPTRSALWLALEDSEWAKSRSPRPLTAATAMLIAKKYKVKISTPVGKRGRQKGCAPVVVGERKSRRIPLDVASELKLVVPLEYQKVADRAAAGSMKAAIKLKCLDCTVYQRREIAGCTIKNCSLYHFRPYKKVDLTEDDNDADAT